MYNLKTKTQTVAVKENNQVMGLTAGSHPNKPSCVWTHSGNSDGQRCKRE